MTETGKQKYLLELSGISKDFPGVRALDDVSINFVAGEVHALVGENGAGKSTLMKIISGVYTPSSGTMVYDGEEVLFKIPYDAQNRGISIIFQEFSLIPELTVYENIFLNREPSDRLGFFQRKKAVERARSILEEMDLEIDLREKVKNLSVVEQQVVEIVKALSIDARILIMDEPTAALSDHEVEKLFAIVETLRTRGVAIIYISHHLDEIFKIADTITVLKDGQLVTTKSADQFDKDSLVVSMVGREIVDYFPERKFDGQDVALSVSNLRFQDEDEPMEFQVHKGEILGITGLMGSGQYRLVKALLGTEKVKSADIEILGQRYVIKSPSDSFPAGFGFVTEDRKATGILDSLTVRENITITDLRNHSAFGFINSKKEQRTLDTQIAAMKIKCSGMEQIIRFLSGGNQQKALISRWLIKNPEILVFMEPTRGIDVGAKAEIYNIIDHLSNEGKTVIIVSSEMTEVIGICDRILVMKDGRIAANLDQSAKKVTEEDIMSVSVGHKYTVVV